MASEWEELEKLSKDELIIRLVYWKNLYGIIRVSEDGDCPYPYAEPKARYEGSLMFPGEITTHEWAVKIAKYAMEHFDGEAFDSSDLMYYGLDEDQCDDVFDELVSKRESGPPSGVGCGGDSE